MENLLAIDPIVQNLVADTLFAILVHLGAKGVEALRDRLRQDDFWASVLKESLPSVLQAAGIRDRKQAENLRQFLGSPEVEAVIRQIYAAGLTGSRDKHQSSIQREFQTALSLHLGLPEDQLRGFSEHLLGSLRQGCDRALQIAIEEGVLSAHEARSSLRFRMLYDELATIEKYLQILAGPQERDMPAILEYERLYRRQVARRHWGIIPPHFDTARKVSIDKLFVAPSFVRPPISKEEERQLLEMPEFLSRAYRAIVLGNPGCGKSTFAGKVCHELAANYTGRFFAARELTPVLVILRDYAAHKKAHNHSILQFIEATANSKYQVSPCPGAFEYLLASGRVVVIFDGLDELLDTHYRREVTGDVESFCNLYPSVPVLVTSREVGYEQAPLDPARFEVVSMAPFGEEQVGEYVRKWFAIETAFTSRERKQKTDAFLEESRIVPDLRSNPLMLALMCNIYRGENYIPKNRPDVYEKCALMLFDRWDKSRGIRIPLLFQEHIRPTMMYLAHWIYVDGQLQSGVTEDKLVARAADYLRPKRFEDRDEAESAARGFVQFCRGRAWVFTDTGSTKEGDSLYQFTHRTFLEYFTARYIVRTHPTPQTLYTYLQPRIARREWDVVAQLAFQIQSRNVEDAADKLLISLVTVPGEDVIEAGSYLSFAARCLEFMVPSPRVSRAIVSACVDYSLGWGRAQMEAGQQRRPDRDGVRPRGIDPTHLLHSLISAADENRVPIHDSLEKLIIQRINTGADEEAVLAAEIGLNLEIPLFGLFPRPRHIDPRPWQELSERISEQCSDRITELSAKHRLICCQAFVRQHVTLGQLVEWYGIAQVFQPVAHVMFSKWTLSSPGYVLLWRFFGLTGTENGFASFERLTNDLENLSRVLLSKAPPWARERHLPPVLMHLQRRDDEGTEWRTPQLSPDALFGAFLLFAASLEESVEEVSVLKSSPHAFFELLRWSFVARFEPVAADKVQAELDRCGFTNKQQSLAWAWIQREVDFVDHGTES